jgi:cytochrome P450
MRLLPVISNGTMRTSKKDFVLGGKYLIPAGASIMVPYYSVFRDPKTWENPEVFDPVRPSNACEPAE